MPINASWDTPTETLTVTFDVPLLPAVLSPGNWHIEIEGDEWEALTADISGSQVIITAQNVGVGPGNEGVSYAAAPDDVRNLSGVPAEPFTGFPIDF